MNKIKNVSKIFRLTFQLLFFTNTLVLPVIYAVAWWRAPTPLALLQNVITFKTLPAGITLMQLLTPATKFYGYLITVASIGITSLGLYYLTKLFKLYEQGIIFKLQTVKLIRNIGYVLLSSQALTIISKSLMSVVLTWDNPIGHRTLTVGISGTNITLALTACLVILISWIMTEACLLKQEQQLTI